jgi:hypothetical protein
VRSSNLQADEDGFLLANFNALKANDDEPFVFPA